jgi:topoisomerase-4 subunit B
MSTEPLRPCARPARATASRAPPVRVWPDAKYFESPRCPWPNWHLLRSKAVLMPGVSVTLTNEKTKDTQTWLYKGGLRDYLMQTLTATRSSRCLKARALPMPSERQLCRRRGRAWCVAFTEDGHPVRESYVNLIPTSAGGTHESGLRDGLFTAVKSFIELHSAAAQGRQAAARRRVCPRQLCAVGQGAGPAVPGPDQGAAELARCRALVSGFVRPALELWLNQHVEYGKKLAELAIKAAQRARRPARRSKSARARAWPCCPAS